MIRRRRPDGSAKTGLDSISSQERGAASGPLPHPPFERRVVVPAFDLPMVLLKWLRCLRTEDDAAEPGALPVEDLLPQDVCMPAVLGEFAQYVEVHPAQRERAAPVAVDPVVQPQG